MIEASRPRISAPEHPVTHCIDTFTLGLKHIDRAFSIADQYPETAKKIRAIGLLICDRASEDMFGAKTPYTYQYGNTSRVIYEPIYRRSINERRLFHMGLRVAIETYFDAGQFWAEFKGIKQPDTEPQPYTPPRVGWVKYVDEDLFVDDDLYVDDDQHEAFDVFDWIDIEDADLSAHRD